MRPPEPSEYGDFYHGYVRQVPDGDVLEILEKGARHTYFLLAGISEDWHDYRYQPGKWSLREVVGHMIDVERVFAYRALSFARRDPAPLPSMEQDDWAAASNAHRRPLLALLDDFRAARDSSLAMLRGLGDGAWDRRGVASGCELSVRACAYILAGHEIHHRKVLEERYVQPWRERQG